MKGFKNWEKKTLQIAHSRTAVPVPKVYCQFFSCWYRYHYATATFFLVGTSTSKCGTDTTLLLPCFSALIPVPIFRGPDTTLQKFPEFSTFWISLYATFFHCFTPPPYST